MRRVVSALVLASLLIACTARPPRSVDSWDEATPESTPWTVRVPPGWDTSTEIFQPGPRDRVGMMTTAISDVAFSPTEHAPSPNGRSGASELGDEAAVVLVRLLWDPNQEKAWDARGNELKRVPPSRWQQDAQNPGWEFRERKLCVGSPSRGNCVSILEWHAPRTSEEEIDRMEAVASTVKLATR